MLVIVASAFATNTPLAAAQPTAIEFAVEGASTSYLSPNDPLASRYLVGATLRIIARLPTSVSYVGTYLTSSDSMVASVGATASDPIYEVGAPMPVRYVFASFTLNAPGSFVVTLSGVDGIVLASRTVEVVACESVRTTIEPGWGEARVDAASCVVAEHSTYFASFDCTSAGEIVPARGALRVALGAEWAPMYGDLLRIEAPPRGTPNVYQYLLSGVVVDELTVESASIDDTRSIELEEFPGYADGWVSFRPRAFDALGRRILGVDFQFTVDGRLVDYGATIDRLQTSPRYPSVPMCAWAGAVSSCVDANVVYVKPRPACSMAPPSDLLEFWPFGLGLLFARGIRRRFRRP